MFAAQLIRGLFGRLTPVLSLVILAGGSFAPPPVAAAPFYGPDAVGSIPGLPDLVDGYEPFDAPVDATGPFAIHEAIYFNGRDLAASPETNMGTWMGLVEGDAFSSAPDLRPRMQDSLDDARRDWTGFWYFADTAIEALVSGAAGAAGFSATVDIFTESDYGFQPERARWLKEQYRRPDSCIGLGSILDPACNHRHHIYSDPVHFDEIRDRGARIFCAASEAFFRAPTETVLMGRRPTVTLDVLGSRLEFLVLEPTVSLAAPTQFATAGDGGARSFSVPFHLGTRLTPFGGLPGLPEVRVPATMLTGDSEVITASNEGSIQNVEFNFGEPVDRSYSGHRKTWQSVGHVDAYVTGERSFRVDGSIPLFAIGPIPVSLGLGIGATIGENRIQGQSLLASPPAGWPSTRSGGPTGGFTSLGNFYNDGFWELSDDGPRDRDIGLLVQGSAARTSLAPENPLLTRAFHDRDKTLEVATRLDVTAQLKAGFDIKTDIIRMAILASGGLNGDVAQYHRVAEEAQTNELFDSFRLTPITALTVSPENEANLDFTASADLRVEVKIPIIDEWVGGSARIFELSERIGGVDRNRWPEATRLRIGTGSVDGVTRTQPLVHSHWPGGADFVSFPGDIDTCLAAPAPEGEPPAPCAPAEPSLDWTPDDIPTLEACFYFPSWEEHRPSWANTPEEIACAEALGSWANSGTPQLAEVDGLEQPVSARIVDPENRAEAEAWAEVVAICFEAFGKYTGATVLSPSLGVCDAKGRIVDAGDIITVDPDGDEVDLSPLDGEGCLESVTEPILSGCTTEEGKADTDCDGIGDTEDLCPDFRQTDPGQTDSNKDGVPDECQCGDPNASGSYESADLSLLYNCLLKDPAAVGVCKAIIARADTNGSGAFESADLIAVYNVMTGKAEAYNLTCPARPDLP